MGSTAHSAVPPDWTELLTPAGAAALEIAQQLSNEGIASSSINQRLRAAGTDPGLTAAALTVVGLRARAEHKFGKATADMLLTQAGLEQASRLVVAELHAARFSGTKTVADLGCGLGAESLAFLRAGLDVRAVELDPLTASFARHNLEVERKRLSAAATELPATNLPVFEVSTGDATVTGPGDADAVFLDPARRTAGQRDTKRLTSVDDYSPSLDFAFTSARAAKAGGVKLGPGFDRELIPEDAEAQWVSVDGSVVEMGLWFGLAARRGVKRSAAVFRTGASPSCHELTAAADAPDAEVRDLGEFIIEPDGAVIRARLIGLLAEQLGAGMIHDGIAYLTADRLPTTPFGQTFRVLEELPSREKDLKRALKARGIGRLEIKKRGVDVDPAALRTRLRLQGSQSGTLILSRSANRHVALLAERC